MSLPRLSSLLLAAVLAFASACSSDSNSSKESSSSDPSASASAATSDPAAQDSANSDSDKAASSAEATSSAENAESTSEIEEEEPKRIVVLAEEYMLSDLLALGIKPIASSATSFQGGLQGLDEYDTSDIEVLGMTSLSLEQLAALKPDIIITLDFWSKRVGIEVLEGAAGEVIIVPDGLHVTDQMRYLGTRLGREEQAEKLINEFNEALAAGKGQLGDDCNVSVAAIYPGPSVAIFLKPIWEVPTTVVGLGCTLVPSAETIKTDQNGRAYVSLEQLALIEGERLILLQSDSIEGERTSVNQITETPLWNQLPAVRNGQVYEFDRLGYPGLSGQIRFINDLITALTS